jgi:hypothetical protein
MQLELMESLHHLLFHLGEFAKGIQSVPTYFFFAPKVYLAYYFRRRIVGISMVSAMVVKDHQYHTCCLQMIVSSLRGVIPKVLKL